MNIWCHFVCPRGFRVTVVCLKNVRKSFEEMASEVKHFTEMLYRVLVNQGKAEEDMKYVWECKWNTKVIQIPSIYSVGLCRLPWGIYICNHRLDGSGPWLTLLDFCAGQGMVGSIVLDKENDTDPVTWR